MIRSAVTPVAVLLTLAMSSSGWAAEATQGVAPSEAVAAAWAMEAEPHKPSSKSLMTLYGSFAAFQALDMISTVQARNRGAREVNPIMGGSYGGAAATKALLAAGSVTAVALIAKKNRKAAFITMVALNAATAVVVVSNYRNTQRLSR